MRLLWFEVAFLFSLSLFANNLEEGMVSNAIAIRDNINLLKKTSDEMLMDGAAEEVNIKKVEDFANKNIISYQTKLNDLIKKYIKKKGHVSFESFLKEIRPEIKEIISGVESGEFNYLDYMRETTYYKLKIVQLVSSGLAEDTSKGGVQKGKDKENKIIVRSAKKGAGYERTFFRNNEPIAQHYVEGSGVIKAKGESINGIVDFYDPQNQLYARSEYKNNKPHGNEIIFYERGAVKREKAFIDGILNGEQRDYYESGKLKMKANYIDGKLDGVIEKYYENGKMEFTATYKNGNADGKATKYNQDGSKLSEASFKNGKLDGEGKMYYNNGNLALDEVYSEGVTVGLSKEYTESGQIKTIKEYKDNGKYYAKHYFLGEVKYVEKTLDGGKEPVILDKETNLYWQKDHKNNPFDQDKNPASFCSSLKYGGYKGWYLPSKSEMETIMDKTVLETPYSRLPGIMPAEYVTSSKDTNGSCGFGSLGGPVKVVDFGNGTVSGRCPMGFSKFKYICVKKKK